MPDKQVVQKQRNSNLELFRILVMLSIIAHHYVVNSGIWKVIQTIEPSTNSLFYYLFGMWGKIGINCFVLITGWFMCTSRITLRKFLKLLLEIEFYKIVIGVVFLLTGKESFSSEWLLGLLPVRSIKTGFVSAFLVFFLLIPFLNILVRNMTRKQHFLLLVLLFFLYTVLSTVPAFSVSMNYVSWFCSLYFYASFMRLYDFPLKENNRAWLVLSLACILISVISVISIRYYPKRIDPYWFVRDSNKLMALAVAICSFHFFRTLRLPYSRFINTLGATTFGVLLIHANSDTMRQWLWTDLLNNVGHLSVPHYAIRSIGIVLLIFAICACIDYLRILLLERPLFILFDNRVTYCQGINSVNE